MLSLDFIKPYSVNFIICLLSLFYHYSAYAQQQNPTVENISLAGADLFARDAEVIFINPASRGDINTPNIGLSIYQVGNLNSLSYRSLGYIHPFTKSHIGGGWVNYGSSNFLWNKWFTSYAIELAEGLTFGVQVDYIFLQLVGKNIHAGTVELGLNYILKDFRFSSYIFNPTNGILFLDFPALYNQTYKYGVSVLPIDDMEVILQYNKHSLEKGQISIGSKYKVADFITVNFGLSLDNILQSLGASLFLDPYHIKISSSSNYYLGWVTALHLSYNLIK